MKKIFWMAAAVVFTLTSCEDFLDSYNYTEANTSNYPAAPADLNKELAALYGVMNQYCNDPLQTPWFVWNIMSDDSNGAGGTGDVESHAIGHLMSNKDALFETAWHSTYVGIARANAIIYAVDAFDWTGQEATRNQLLGEAYFMRGLYYLWGVQFWGDIPAYWSAAAPDPCPQVSAEEVTFPHILADFVSAMNLMQHGATQQGDGHATKGAAEGYLARAYMFYQGFYKKAGELKSANLAEVVLPQQEGVTGNLSKSDVEKALRDCIDNGGYKLLSDFRLLWQYTNELTSPDYPFVRDLASTWAGNGNEEQIFQVQFGNMASWNGTIGMGFTNMTSLYCSLRCDEDASGNVNGGQATFPFGQGWGQATFNYNSVGEWSNSDPRKRATVLVCDEELEKFAYTTSCSEETGFYNKKWMSVTCNESTWSDNTKAYTWWGVYRSKNSTVANNNGNSFQGDHFADIILLRLSDVMLMYTELTGDASEMNKVRARAGLPEIAYSWDNIQSERRWELYGEGIRFNDIRRWSGKDTGEGSFAATALQKQDGSTVNYMGTWTTMHHASSSWAKRYSQTNGFLPIPPAQIRNIDDASVLKQNAGWGDDLMSDWNMSGTPVY
ncbi:MAG: RagB/SusD family nutrient uptake outer membrane protein [Marinilabiliaceae bacterium]|nr:RagB/SusD family nutrient uptake outer membrane protein [Marinilabiliaceae bacterium]